MLFCKSSIPILLKDDQEINLNGEYPAITALLGGGKRCNIKEIPCLKAPPFRAGSFNFCTEPLEPLPSLQEVGFEEISLDRGLVFWQTAPGAGKDTMAGFFP
jgi:hypothetical protein